MHYKTKKLFPWVHQAVIILVAGIFAVSSVLCVPLASAADTAPAPDPGAILHLTDTFSPALIRGITLHPENPLAIDFIIEHGDQPLEQGVLDAEAEKMVKYFLAGLTIPENDLWVNLSPVDQKRIVPEAFGRTEMGRDMLGQDYILKQLSSSLINPDQALGRDFWDRVYQKAVDQYGTMDIPVNTFHRIWIVPEKAVVHQNGATALVLESRLKVLLEEDYLALKWEQDRNGLQGRTDVPDPAEERPDMGTDIMRELVVPEIQREVNEGRHFAPLRQMMNALILATWYKKTLKESLLGRIYIDRNKVSGIDLALPQDKEDIYNRYVSSLKKGIYNYIREEIDPVSQQPIPRKYFSGGWAGKTLSQDTTITEPGDGTDNAALAQAAEERMEQSGVTKYAFRMTEPGEQPAPAQRADEAMLAEGDQEIWTVLDSFEDDGNHYETPVEVHKTSVMGVTAAAAERNIKHWKTKSGTDSQQYRDEIEALIFKQIKRLMYLAFNTWAREQPKKTARVRALEDPNENMFDFFKEPADLQELAQETGIQMPGAIKSLLEWNPAARFGMQILSFAANQMKESGYISKYIERAISHFTIDTTINKIYEEMLSRLEAGEILIALEDETFYDAIMIALNHAMEGREDPGRAYLKTYFAAYSGRLFNWLESHDENFYSKWKEAVPEREWSAFIYEKDSQITTREREILGLRRYFQDMYLRNKIRDAKVRQEMGISPLDATHDEKLKVFEAVSKPLFEQLVTEQLADQSMMAATHPEEEAATRTAVTASTDLAITKPEKTGGIDYNPDMMDLQIIRDENGVPLPLEFQDVETMDVKGLVPVMINATPVTNIPMLFGLNSSPEPEDRTRLSRNL